MSDRILIVEDDAAVADVLNGMLEGAGYATKIAGLGQTARTEIAADDYDLVLIDLGLPDEDGQPLVRDLARQPHLGLIVVSGRQHLRDCVVALENGADDYVSKPFDRDELLARVRSVLRRRVSPEDRDGGAVTFGPWTLDRNAHQLQHASGRAVSLTPAEFRLLSLFAAHPHRLLSRAAIMDLLYANDADAPFDRSIDVTVTRLRRKIETDPLTPRFIRTVRGAGYIFDATGEAA